jgi:hypothetical protein
MSRLQINAIAIEMRLFPVASPLQRPAAHAGDAVNLLADNRDSKHLSKRRRRSYLPQVR